MQAKTVFVLCLTLLWFASLCPAAEERVRLGGLDGLDPLGDSTDYPVLLALSGGGARGLAAIGVLKAFEEKNLTIRGIAGTSMGGIVGGLYACGYTPDELADTVGAFDFSEVFSNQPARSTMFQTRRADRDRHLVTIRFDGITPYIPQGLTTGQKLTALFTRLTTKANYLAGGDFSRFVVPFVTVSTDVVSGELVPLRGGSLSDAMRATMAFPLAFTGVETDGRLLMDGGMLAPVPVDLARALVDSVSFVVAVNTTSPLVGKDDLTTPVDIAGQVTSIMTADQLRDQLSRASYVVTPAIESYSSSDFDSKDSLIALGYRAGLSAADSIIALQEAQHRARLVRIHAVRVAGVDRFHADRLHAELIDRLMSRRELIAHLRSFYREVEPFQIEAIIRDAVLDEGMSSDHAVDVEIVVEPALPRERVTVTFDNNAIYDDSTLTSLMRLSDGDISARDLRAGIDSIRAQYRRDGYDFADIRTISYNRDSARVTIAVDEAIIRRIDVENNSRSRDWLIRSYFPFRVGQPYSTSGAAQGVSNLYGTDLFDRVSVDLIPYRGGAIVKIQVVEKRYTQLRVGWHWVDEYQSEEFFELRDDNLYGVGLEALAHARVGKDRWQYFVKGKLDRIFFTYMTAQTRLFYERIDRSLFSSRGVELGEREEERWGGEFTIGQQIARLGTVTAGLTTEAIRWYDKVEDAGNRMSLRSLTLESRVENLDHVPFPTSGNQHHFKLQLTGEVFGGDVEFTKYYSSLESYWTFGTALTVHPRVAIGLSRTGMPPPEKFYVGGAQSFVGYHTDELSGDKVFLFNQEVRLNLPLNLYAIARFDIGDVYSSTDQIKLRNLRHGYGAFAAYSSPLGPIEFGYGRADDDVDQFYFNAGFAF
ncbi:MAG: patatin-like phospholipase family protein [candidate division Zixibacteria bacterium]|jgi:NTE family protein|nr:patatin-like phospholipase family protein [candidate division Zixibacteria bacterium]